MIDAQNMHTHIFDDVVDNQISPDRKHSWDAFELWALPAAFGPSR